MNANQADQILHLGDEGTPIVRLMHDPDLSGPDGHLSLVDRGANGRRIQVYKGEKGDRPDQAMKGALADTLNRRIDEMAGEDRSRAEIVDAMAAAGGIEAGTVNQILRGEISTPPDPRLRGFAQVLGLSFENLKELAAKAEDLQPLVETTLDLGQTTSQTSWWRRMFSAVLTGPVVVKADAVTFDEAVTVPRVFERLHEGFDALLHAVATTLHDETVRDKQAAIDQALSRFAIWVSDALSLPTLKADQQVIASAQVRQIWDQLTARKQADRLSVADVTAVFEAQQALQQAGAALDTLAAKAAQRSPVTPSEGSMNTAQLQAVADAAAASAIKAAKLANPAATPAELQAVGVSASQEVFKAAVMGPRQPALPPDNLSRQIAQSQAVTGAPGDPMSVFQRTLNRIERTTMKNSKALFGDRDDQGQVVEGGDPGALAVLETVVKGHGGLVDVVRKFSGTAAPSRQTRETPKTTETVIKNANSDPDACWEDSPLSFS